MRLKDKAALVTRGVAGIGAATAIELAKDGAAAVVTERRGAATPEKLDPLEDTEAQAVERERAEHLQPSVGSNETSSGRIRT